MVPVLCIVATVVLYVAGVVITGRVLRDKWADSVFALDFDLSVAAWMWPVTLLLWVLFTVPRILGGEPSECDAEDCEDCEDPEDIDDETIQAMTVILCEMRDLVCKGNEGIDALKERVSSLESLGESNERRVTGLEGRLTKHESRMQKIGDAAKGFDASILSPWTYPSAFTGTKSV